MAIETGKSEREKPAGPPGRPGRQGDPEPGSFRRDLLSWYDRAKRDLPWRRSRKAYPVWVSEIMLQQTRVDSVIGRYERFLRAFPTLSRLARAEESAVLSEWSGLGYYSRARNLRRAAGIVAETYRGRFPPDLGAALQLPGVGLYTASAILSIAYGLPHPVVDGNVARVLSRLYRLEPPGDHQGPLLLSLAAGLLDRDRPGDHNQAMMELGALVCLPRQPRCAECPVRASCAAFLAGVAGRYPRPRKRPKTVELTPTLLLLRSPGGRLLLECGQWGLLPHLWLPPILDSRTRGRPPRIASALRRGLRDELGAFRHSITHHKLRFCVRGGLISLGPGRLPNGFRLLDEGGLQEIGRSTILVKALQLERAFHGAQRPAEGGRAAQKRISTLKR